MYLFYFLFGELTVKVLELEGTRNLLNKYHNTTFLQIMAILIYLHLFILWTLKREFTRLISIERKQLYDVRDSLTISYWNIDWEKFNQQIKKTGKNS